MFRRKTQKVDRLCRRCGDVILELTTFHSLCGKCLQIEAYNITDDNWESVLNDQNGRCPGCEEYLVEVPKIDVGVRTVGREFRPFFRGLLCKKCDLAVQLTEGDPSTLTSLAAYLISAEEFNE